MIQLIDLLLTSLKKIIYHKKFAILLCNFLFACCCPFSLIRGFIHTSFSIVLWEIIACLLFETGLLF